jgi:hypothetical protein
MCFFVLSATSATWRSSAGNSATFAATIRNSRNISPIRYHPRTLARRDAVIGTAQMVIELVSNKKIV